MTAPDLSCVVMSYRDEPNLVAAVRSLLEQSVPVEVVVVNSGGGNPAGRLAAAGVRVPVHSVEHRLYPGAARNAGLDMTTAPYVSFLAADCLATPGWAAARLRAHRNGASAVASPLTNANPESVIAWSSLLLQHNRRLAVTRPSQRLHYSLSYERALFERFGRFREDLRAGEDTEFNDRLRGFTRIVLAEDAVTAHRYPTAMRDMLRDAFRRGSLQARMQGAIDGGAAQRLRVAASGPRNVIRSLIVSLRSDPPDRGALLRACPLVVLGAAAYSAGALLAVGAEHDRR
ncbi:MAG TPA: glycosyltransferase family A protein [Gemmatimonadaceae bacterium]|nr:glycosyltransferase family A protein [Gemmatimonadaceae bacterium]